MTVLCLLRALRTHSQSNATEPWEYFSVAETSESYNARKAPWQLVLEKIKVRNQVTNRLSNTQDVEPVYGFGGQNDVLKPSYGHPFYNLPLDLSFRCACLWLHRF